MNGNRASNAQLLSGLSMPGAVDGPTWRLRAFRLHRRHGARAGWHCHRLGAKTARLTEQGAYTGEVSALMLADIGCRYVIVGHSERRAYHAESTNWWPTRPRSPSPMV